MSISIVNEYSTIETEELKFENTIKSQLPNLRSMRSALYKLYPSIDTIHPNTVHQIWIQGEEHLRINRPHFYTNYKEYQRLNHGRTFLWSEEMIESLIVHVYPQLLTLYHSYSHFIMRVDLAKYIILHHYGGFYVDMDSECRLNFDALANMSINGRVVVCKVTDDYRTQLYSRKFINNHFFYVPSKHHPLMTIMLKQALITAERKPLEPMILYILRAIGPGFLMHCIKIYKKQCDKEAKASLNGIHKVFYKKHTEDVMTVIETDILDKFFFHESKNTWLEDQWMDKLDKRDYSVLFGALAMGLGSFSFLFAADGDILNKYAHL